VTTSNYLRVYLCLGSVTCGVEPQPAAACLSARPEDMGVALPEVRWWAAHRHVAIRDWYTI
jgi:hypothetical protein